MKSFPESVVVLGNIDGFHRGHQELVRRALQIAQSKNLPVIAATFDPHPIEILKPQSGFQRLFSLRHQQALLIQAGVQTVHYFKFDRELSQVPAEDFLNRFLVPVLKPRAVVVGFNFRFGRERGGGPDELRKWGQDQGLEVVIVPAQEWHGEVVSSTQVRKYLVTGQVNIAADLLGFPFFIEGVVEPGAGRGRGLGFPTANISCPPTQIPAFGVYASQVHFKNQILKSVSHLGPLPSFGDSQARLETFVLAGNWDLRGALLKVDFIERIRDVRKFESIEALSQQIKSDIARAQEIHGPS